MRLTILAAAAAAVALAGCGAQQFDCPPSIPGKEAGELIPVIVVADDTGRPVDPADVGGLGGPELACEADANANGVGDEYEVEVLEESLNGLED